VWDSSNFELLRSIHKAVNTLVQVGHTHEYKLAASQL